jgi:type VI secretion system protein ImpK
MRSDLAELVYPVIDHALGLRERLRAGQQPSLAVEQSVLLGLLGASADGSQVADYVGDRTPPGTRGVTGADHDATGFCGARYALVCWLDELFILDSPWSESWNEHKLEAALYASNDRAWRFWNQAQVAASRAMVDALEVFYLCAMLGFRGELRDAPESFAEWCKVTLEQIRRARARNWAGPPDLLPLPPVPALRGRQQLRTLLLATSLTAVLLVPFVLLLLLCSTG